MSHYGGFEYGGENAVYAGGIVALVVRAIRAGMATLSKLSGSPSTSPREGATGD